MLGELCHMQTTPEITQNTVLFSPLNTGGVKLIYSRNLISYLLSIKSTSHTMKKEQIEQQTKSGSTA